MTPGQRIILGVKEAIKFSEELITAAYEEVPPQQVHHYTTNYRRLLRTQVNFLRYLEKK